MKSEVTPPKEAKEIKYPCLMYASECKLDILVLFHSYRKGTVVGSTSDIQPIGRYCDSWIMKEFKPFKGSVTLSND